MMGTLQFELKQWQKALELLTKAKLIYEKMSSALTGDAVLIYKQKVADIEPSIRWDTGSLLISLLCILMYYPRFLIHKLIVSFDFRCSYINTAIRQLHW